MKCYECEKGELIRKNVEYKKYGIAIGTYPAEVCTKCGEIFFDSDAVGKIEEKVKKMGLFGLRNKTKVGTSGNALDIKLYKKLIDFLNLQKGQTVEIEPINKNKFEVNLV
jgi:YgiT-type zinc finger domain-containing protein